ncbi:MAG: glycoside hydrolase family 11 protein [Ruminococcus sp.]|uniref:dockerin type I repeat-containing protein n=1 Tax=Ruminococcus sp. TaxID=41978 RepID=UPI001B21D8AC|nr:glycoside hydrolase family 11 protein [Ruminococcus sp.]MBO7473201.1 glycoside hydrolase family 11 protein [Ruminococcus sp.]
MTFSVFKRIISAATATLCFSAAVPTLPLKVGAENTKITSYEGYDYEYWSDTNNNTISFDIDKKGGFDAEWNAYGNCFFAKGLINQKPISNNYKIDYDLSISFTPVQNAKADEACTYICAYGYLKNPAAEFFFMDYGSNLPDYENIENCTSLGSFDVDGNTYDLYSQKRYEHTIDGSLSYPVFLSVRRDGEMECNTESSLYSAPNNEYSSYSGRIDVGAHLYALENLGQEIGDLDRLSLNVESYRCSGAVKLNSCEITDYLTQNDFPNTSGTFEKNGGTYTYYSTSRPSKVNMRVNPYTDDKEFDYRWQDGTNKITKTFLSEPVKIGTNDLILFKNDYSFKLSSDDPDNNSFSGILEMELNDCQKLCLVDTGTDFGEDKITALYNEKGIEPKLTVSVTNRNILDLPDTMYDTRKQELKVYSYTLKSGNTEEKHTDYWITNYQYDFYYYNKFNLIFCGENILCNSSYSCYNIIKISDVLRFLKEYGLSYDTINTASYTFNSEGFGGSLSVNSLKLDITHFPNGSYKFSPEYYGDNNFSINSNKNGLFDFNWNNSEFGACTALAEKHFDGSGLALSDIKSIVADYSVTVDSVETFGNTYDETSVYLRGKLPKSDSSRNELYIDIAYFTNTPNLKSRIKPISSDNSIEDNDKIYNLYVNSNEELNGFCVSGFISNDDSLNTQYWSLEQDPPVNGDNSASFSGSIDITKHITKYITTDNNGAWDILSDLAICAEANRSVGSVSIEKFDIIVTYNDGSVIKYTPGDVSTSSENFMQGDINDDGVFSISDVVTLQKWLLGSRNISIKNWKAADLNYDSVLDIFDLCMMKKAIIRSIKLPVAVNINETGGYAGVNRIWKVYKENEKYIVSYQDLKRTTEQEPIITEITESEYNKIMAQDYERNSTPQQVWDGFHYKSVITYKDGTEKTTNSDMLDTLLIIEKLSEK